MIVHFYDRQTCLLCYHPYKFNEFQLPYIIALMNLKTVTLIMIPLHITNAEILSDYHCGIGKVSKVISYLLSSTCGREKRKSLLITSPNSRFQSISVALNTTDVTTEIKAQMNWCSKPVTWILRNALNSATNECRSSVPSSWSCPIRALLDSLEAYTGTVQVYSLIQCL